MIKYHSARQKFPIIFLMLILAGITAHTQKVKRPQPVWWFGASGAANFNFNRGTTQMLNDNLTVPTAFHKGDGIKPYVSVLTEFRPGKVWGGMLNLAFDNRGSEFDGVMAPCNCPATLSTNVSYLTIEPSLRIAPFGSSFYIFGGPTVAFNLKKEFIYTQEKKADKRGDWSGIRSTVLSGQAGAGVDIPISARTSSTQVTLSPFASFQTDFGHEPRSVESWSFYTIRAGIALKFGASRKPASVKPIPEPEKNPEIVPEIVPEAVVEKEVDFSVRAPMMISSNRQVKETFPLRNSVFFDMGSAAIPDRYIKLNKTEAKTFKEGQLQEAQPDNLTYGRSSRQLAVYHNILNIIGDRMRANPGSSITLTGASDKNPVEGKLMAANIKQYLVTVFNVNSSRINIEGRDKPLIPSEQPGATKDLALLREGDRRVDIASTSPALLMQVGEKTSPFLRPVNINAVQEDPFDSYVIFSPAGANELLKSWSVEITDEQGNVQYYGPYIEDEASVSGKTILGKNAQGNYKVLMTGETKSGHSVTKETTLSLTKMDDAKQEGLRYSILFDFDKSKTNEAYEKFLTDMLVPVIPDNSTVIIHGHTDIIGDEKYNNDLSRDRATEVQQIIQRGLTNAGRKGVKFNTKGFGEDAGISPFENNLPEQRFYNRTVIIDIVPVK